MSDEKCGVMVGHTGGVRWVCQKSKDHPEPWHQDREAVWRTETLPDDNVRVVVEAAPPGWKP